MSEPYLPEDANAPEFPDEGSNAAVGALEILECSISEYLLSPRTQAADLRRAMAVARRVLKGTGGLLVGKDVSGWEPEHVQLRVLMEMLRRIDVAVSTDDMALTRLHIIREHAQKARSELAKGQGRD